MRVQFVARENGPERLVTDGEIHFDEGPLAGCDSLIATDQRSLG